MKTPHLVVVLCLAVPFALAACQPLPGDAPPPPGPAGLDPAIAAYLAQQQRDENLNRRERRELQTHLKDLGYNIGPSDGMIGERTRDGIRGFQAASGLPVTGLYSMALLNMLRSATSRLGAGRSTVAGTGGGSYGGGSDGAAAAGGSDGAAAAGGSGGVAAAGGGGTTGGGSAAGAATGGSVAAGGGTTSGAATSSGGGALVTSGGGTILLGGDPPPGASTGGGGGGGGGSTGSGGW